MPWIPCELWLCSFHILSLVCSAKRLGWTSGPVAGVPPPWLQEHLHISLCCLFRKEGHGLGGKGSLATMTSHKNYLCVLKEIINTDWDMQFILFSRIAKCCWKLRFGQVTVLLLICQTLYSATMAGFGEHLSVGNPPELAVALRSKQKYIVFSSACSLIDVSTALLPCLLRPR